MVGYNINLHITSLPLGQIATLYPVSSVLYMLFDTALSIFTTTSIKKHIEYFNFRSKIQLDHLLLRRVYVIYRCYEPMNKEAFLRVCMALAVASAPQPPPPPPLYCYRYTLAIPHISFVSSSSPTTTTTSCLLLRSYPHSSSCSPVGLSSSVVLCCSVGRGRGRGTAV